MAKPKLVKKELVKQIRALNKLKLTGRVSPKGDPEDLLEDFITAIEKIDDDGKISKVKDPILDYYEQFIPEDGDDGGKDDDGGDFDADELTEELEDMSLKEVKAFIEENDLDIKVTKKTLEDKIDDIVEAMEEKAEGGDDGDDEPEDFDIEKFEEELDEMSLKEVKALVKEHDLDVGRVTKKNLEDKLEDIVEAMEEKMEGDGDSGGEKDLEDMDKDELLEYAEENDIELTERMQNKFTAARLLKTIKKKMDAAGSKKDKAEKKDKARDYPKGIRKNTLIAELYDGIKDDGATVKELAKPIAKKKDKEPAQVYGVVMRNVIRKLGKAVPVVLKPADNGEDGSVFIELDE